MRLTVEQGSEYSEVEITIHCREIDKRLSDLIRQIRLYGFSIPVKKDGREYSLPSESIFYIESIDERTYVYQKNDVFDCGIRLYELENRLEGTAFTRIGRALLLNISVVESVRPILGGRLEVLLENEEKLIVNRHYVPSFRRKFGSEGYIL